MYSDFCDDQRHRLADKTDPLMREPGSERNAERAAADALEERHRRRAFPAGGDEIGAGQDVENARQLSRRRRVDPRNLGMRPVGARRKWPATCPLKS